jgi:predicted dithiol-disulfide oxidoreductase (DUF899 family)
VITARTATRGTDALNATWQLLDRSPKARYNADGWPRRHDEYEPAGTQATEGAHR